MIKLLTKKNYITMIRSAAKGENHMFRNMFGSDENGEKDLTKDGALSCGKVVSAILYLNKLIKDLHLTVESTEKDMKENGWQEISELKEGAVIVWEPKPGADGTPHLHMGFYLSGEEAMSNDSNGNLVPAIHHPTFGANADGSPVRKIIRIYWHSALDES
ncbi:MAG: hypothetical protein KW806_00400 [Candidatus Yanofskybacteria bacterium]|nr:hypothetical protein [Candidatus Yanofskybacteria bacterium]